MNKYFEDPLLGMLSSSNKEHDSDQSQNKVLQGTGASNKGNSFCLDSEKAASFNLEQNSAKQSFPSVRFPSQLQQSDNPSPQPSQLDSLSSNQSEQNNSIREESLSVKKCAKFILKKQKKGRQDNNAINFFIKMIKQHHRQYHHLYENRQIAREVQKNVQQDNSPLNYLRGYLSNTSYDQKTRRINRKAFNEMLKKQTIPHMQRPRSQVKDKVEYLHTAKVLALRCISEQLVGRIQSH